MSRDLTSITSEDCLCPWHNWRFLLSLTSAHQIWIISTWVDSHRYPLQSLFFSPSLSPVKLTMIHVTIFSLKSEMSHQAWRKGRAETHQHHSSDFCIDYSSKQLRYFRQPFSCLHHGNQTRREQHGVQTVWFVVNIRHLLSLLVFVVSTWVSVCSVIFSRKRTNRKHRSYPHR